MTQKDFNRRIVELLALAVMELRRSTRSQDWDNMVGLQNGITDLFKRLPVAEVYDEMRNNRPAE